MKTFTQYAAQGDIIIIRIKDIPDDVVKQEPENNQHIVAHSETGHHHVVPAKDADFYRAANDDMVMYLAVSNETRLEHLRSFDTHEEISFDKGNYIIKRQREHTPDGWRRVED